MTFDGVDDFLTLAGLPAWPQHTIIAVAHGGTLASRIVNYSGTGGSVAFINDSATALRPWYLNGASTSKVRTKTAGATFRAIAVFNTAVGADAVPEFYLDGVDQGATYSVATASNGPITGTPAFAMGASTGGTVPFDGSIAEVIVYNRALSGDEIEVVDEWLRARYVIPPYFNNVELWLDLTSPDTSIVDGAVAVLGDRSGNGRHATAPLTTNRPAYIARDPDFGGRPSLTGDGIDDVLATASWAPSGNTITWYVVAAGSAAVSSSNERMFEHGRTLTRYASTTQIRSEFASTGSTTRSAPVTLETPHVIAMVFDAAVAATAMQAIYVDGAEVSSVV